MGESAKLHTKCQQEYNSDRSVVSEFNLGFSQSLCVQCTRLVGGGRGGGGGGGGDILAYMQNSDLPSNSHCCMLAHTVGLNLYIFFSAAASAPTGLAAEVVGHTSIRVLWTAPTSGAL